MKKQAITLAVLFLSLVALGQGVVTLNNRVTGLVDARVRMPDGTAVGAGFTAQLLAGPAGTAVDQLVAVTPTTTFKTGSPAALGYVNAVDVTVPGVAPGAEATLVVRVFNDAEYGSSSIRGQSSAITVALGGGGLPPAILTGLTFPMPIAPSSWIRATKGQLTNQIRVSWSQSPSKTAYAVWRNTSRDFDAATRIADNVRTNEYLDLHVKPGVKYYYWNGLDHPDSGFAAGYTPADFNRDGQSDVVFRNQQGLLGAWFMEDNLGFWEIGHARISSARFLTPDRVDDESWRPFGTGDFNRDGKPDLAFQHADGRLVIWLMDGIKSNSIAWVEPRLPGEPNWKAVGTGCFSSEDKTDLVFQHADGTLAVWFLDGPNLTSATLFEPSHPGDTNWRVVGTGDFNMDGSDDLLFQHTDGRLAAWILTENKMIQATLMNPSTPENPQWRVVSTVDRDQDGKPDLLFQHSGEGTLAVWFMNGVNLRSAQLLNPAKPGGTWQVVAP